MKFSLEFKRFLGVWVLSSTGRNGWAPPNRELPCLGVKGQWVLLWFCVGFAVVFQWFVLVLRWGFLTDQRCIDPLLVPSVEAGLQGLKNAEGGKEKQLLIPKDNKILL